MADVEKAIQNVRVALERIRDFPYVGVQASHAIVSIARDGLASLEALSPPSALGLTRATDNLLYESPPEAEALREFSLASSAPRRGEAAAVAIWFTAHDAYHKASDAYNARLAYIQAERERTKWEFVGNVDHEYKVLNEAQRAAIKAAETLYQTLRALPATPQTETNPPKP